MGTKNYLDGTGTPYEIVWVQRSPGQILRVVNKETGGVVNEFRNYGAQKRAKKCLSGVARRYLAGDNQRPLRSGNRNETRSPYRR